MSSIMSLGSAISSSARRTTSVIYVAYFIFQPPLSGISDDAASAEAAAAADDANGERRFVSVPLAGFEELLRTEQQSNHELAEIL